MRPARDDYTRSGRLVRIIDGDTVELEINLGFTATVREICRIYGINTPEIRGVEDKEPGRKATTRLVEILHERGPELLVRTHKNRRGKFGRYLVEIWGIDGDETESVNDQMVREGHAVEYMRDRS